jgi:hypothetical protein
MVYLFSHFGLKDWSSTLINSKNSAPGKTQDTRHEEIWCFMIVVETRDADLIVGE